MKHKSYIFQILSILSLSSTHLLSIQPAKLIIKRVVSSESRKKIALFIDDATQNYIAPHEGKPLHSQRYQEFTQIAPMLMQAIETFHETPGFGSSLHTLLLALGRKEAKGYIYELQKALDIYEGSQGQEHIKQINGTLILNSEIVYIDLLTSERVIECKALHWNKKPSDDNPIATKLCNQFVRQKEGVETFNQAHNSSLCYQVHSLFEIPGVWKEWFSNRDISVVEEKN